MASTDIEPSELTKWDPGLTERVMGISRPFLKGYLRSEVRGLENMPPGGALVVSNHSGGMLPMDVPILAAEFYDEYGYGRPLYTLSHDMLLVGPTGDFFKKIGYISANHENADEALRSGGRRRGIPWRRLRRVPADAVGEHHRLRRPHGLREGRAECRGADRSRRSASAARRRQLYLSRGTWLAKRARPDRTPGPRQDRADLVRIPVRPEPGDPAQPPAARQDRHAGAAARSTSSPSSARTPTSTRSTLTSGTSCSGRSTN